MNKNYQTPSLMHGGMTNKIREGFTENTKNPYKDIQDKFKDLGRRIQWPNNGGEVDVSKEMNEAIDNYQKLYCLKKGTPSSFSTSDTNWNFGEQVKKGQPILTLAGTGNDGGNCKKPPEWKIEHGDKVVLFMENRPNFVISLLLKPLHCLIGLIFDINKASFT